MKLRSIFLCALLACATSLPAFYRPCSCELIVSAEWLYMLQGLDQPSYAIDGNVDRGGGYDLTYNVVGEREANEQTWKSGYRIELLYGLCECESSIGLRWTHLPTFSNSSTTDGGALWNTISLPANVMGNGKRFGIGGSAHITDEFDFYSLEVLYRRHFIERCGFDTGLYFGLQYAKIDLDERYALFPSSNGYTYYYPYFNQGVHYQSELWGIGPELGAEFFFSLPCCLSVTARCHGALLASKRSASLDGGNAPEGEFDYIFPKLYAVQDRTYWTVIPTVDARVGLTYDCCFSRCEGGLSRCGPAAFHFEVGYEFVSYRNAISRIRFDDAFAAGDSYNEQINFNLHGPYVHLGLRF